MADARRAPATPLGGLEGLGEGAVGSDFFSLLRRLEVMYRDRPRVGAASAPREEAFRVTQRPRSSCATSAVAALEEGQEGRPHQLEVAFTGLFGSRGALPLAWTEALERRAAVARRARRSDPFVDLVDLFHHRTFTLLYRAWSQSRAVVARDRPREDRFAWYLGALIGHAEPTAREGSLPEDFELSFAGRLVSHGRNPEGLEAMAQSLLGVPVEIDPFVGEWLAIPEEYGWKLGDENQPNARSLGLLGESTLIGPEVYERQYKFRLVVGPLGHELLADLLPGGRRLGPLKELVSLYAGGGLRWDLRVKLEEGAIRPVKLGEWGRLGDTSYLLVDETDIVPEHLIDPAAD